MFKPGPAIIRLAVMLYVRFSLSLRNVKDLLRERCVDFGHETFRYWWHRVGPMFASETRKRRIEGLKTSHRRWHLGEGFVKIDGARHCLWRAVGHKGKVLESFVTKARDKKPTLRFLRKAIRKHGSPRVIVANCLRPYGPALRENGAANRQETSCCSTIEPKTHTCRFAGESVR
jgi:putative transposase